GAMRVVVVGGGTFGVSAAHSLALRGHAVTLLDRLPIPAEDAASTDLNKVVRTDYGDEILYQELCLKAIATFKKWNEDCLRRFGHILYHEVGVAYVTKDPNMNSFERTSIEAIKRSRVDPDAGSQIEAFDASTKATLVKKFPAFAETVKEYPGGYFNYRGGFADSGRTIAYLAQLALEAGVRFVTGPLAGRVRSFERDGSRVVGIRTADGQLHAADLVVAAAGSWTPSLVPQLHGLCHASGQAVVQLRPPPGAHNCSVWFADVSKTGFYGFPGAPRDGGATVKIANHGVGFLPPDAFHQSGDVTPKHIPRVAVLEFRDFLAKAFPHLNKFDIVNTRLCWYCDAWDSNFYIDHVPDSPGLFVATGGSGHGFKFTPVLGEVIADLAEGKPSPYRELFRWRAPAPGGPTSVPDPIRDAESYGRPRQLAEEPLADADDLSAAAYAAGRLAARVKADADSRKKGTARL
ncbi:hypothetical protein HK405_007014, partial [Cladochytrium tenue]